MGITEIEKLLPQHAMREVTGLPFTHLNSGKVREIFDLGDDLLLVATDRLSAFDVILPDGVPGKGMLLTQISLWWFARTRPVIANHLVANHDVALRETLAGYEHLIPYSMRVRKLKPLPLEAVVRGYLAGSGWKCYRESGALWGRPLPPGLNESVALPEPMFTPTSKAQQGHDLPLSDDEAKALVGAETFAAVREAALAIFALGSEAAREAGLILADTKFEFGTDDTGRLYLIDEVLTPDSSRFWPAAGYQPGKAQPAFDKQFVRDYLETLDWNKQPPGPHLPPDVLHKTREKYLQAVRALLGKES